MSNSNKTPIYRAGTIPYVVENGQVLMMFMKPSNPEYGGDTFQIAKGRVEDGEDNMTAHTIITAKPLTAEAVSCIEILSQTLYQQPPVEIMYVADEVCGACTKVVAVWIINDPAHKPRKKEKQLTLPVRHYLEM